MEPDTCIVIDRGNVNGLPPCAANHAVCYASDNATLNNVADDNTLNHNYLGVTGGNGRMINHVMENGHRWLFDLCVAASRYRLQPANIRTYFAMQHIIIDDSGALRDTIYFITSRHHGVFIGAVNAINDIEWGRYRLSISSIGSCFERAVTAYSQPVMTRVLGAVQYNICDAYRQAPWDNALLAQITEASIGIIAVSLDAGRTLPNGWISGNRALREMPRVTNMRLTRLFTRISDLQAATANIDNAQTVENALIAAGF